MKNNFVGEPPRERKHRIGTKFVGKLSELIAKGPDPNPRTLVDFTNCTLSLSLNILLYFSDTVVLFHTPNGCLDEAFSLAYIVNKARSLEDQKPFLFELRNTHICTTGLKQHQVIFGGETKLKKAILEASERYNPRLIAVMASCTSAIIGDDIEMVCREAQNEIGDQVYVVPFMTHGFQSPAWNNYAYRVWEPLVDHIMQEPNEIQPETINFFRPLNMSHHDVEEMERLMDFLDLKVNIFPDFQSIESLELAPEACLNTGLCKSFHLPVFERMYERFNTPYTDAPYPCGIEFTKRWLRELGRKLNRTEDTERLIELEMQRITPELERLRSLLQGKTAYVAANHAKTMSFVQVCNDLGLKVLSASTQSTDDSLIEEYQVLKNEVGDFDVHVGSPMYEEMSYLARARPDINLVHGELGGFIASRWGMVGKSTFFYNFQETHFGFQGVIEIGKQMVRGLGNPLK
ncbi:MAG: nitrogenase component 1, partial [Desulfuromonadaceae bacterium]